ncbi:MAG: DUF2851 family protein, partial [Bacteroidia bacterium]
SHSHHTDKNYDSVILHVVYHHDGTVYYSNKKPIPELELRDLIPPLMLRKFRILQNDQNTIACEKIFKVPSQPMLTNWLERLLIERLEQKCALIESILVQNKNNWEETFYFLTARYFGMKTNAVPFEWLAQLLPLSILAKHKNSLVQIEALVFGVAGFLEEKNKDAYIGSLKNEFDFLKKKYSLKPLDKKIWKFARTRPANFPTVRLSQFAVLIFHSSNLLSKVLSVKTISQLAALYKIKPDPKLDPFLFIDHQTKAENTVFGKDATDILLVNSVFPMLFLYGKINHLEELCERALKFFEHIPAEKNAITRFWDSLGIATHSAFESQALIQLKNNYCSKLNCLNCTFGKEILLNRDE